MVRTWCRDLEFIQGRRERVVRLWMCRRKYSKDSAALMLALWILSSGSNYRYNGRILKRVGDVTSFMTENSHSALWLERGMPVRGKIPGRRNNITFTPSRVYSVVVDLSLLQSHTLICHKYLKYSQSVFVISLAGLKKLNLLKCDYRLTRKISETICDFLETTIKSEYYISVLFWLCSYIVYLYVVNVILNSL